MAIAPSPVTAHHGIESGTTLLTPTSMIFRWIVEIPRQSPLLNRIKQDELTQPLTLFIREILKSLNYLYVLLWTLSSSALYFLY